MIICLQDRFAICYKTTMESLIGILHTESNTFGRLIHANCLACVSHIPITVGKERFNENVVQVIIHFHKKLSYFSQFTLKLLIMNVFYAML